MMSRTRDPGHHQFVRTEPPHGAERGFESWKLQISQWLLVKGSWRVPVDYSFTIAPGARTDAHAVSS